MRNIVIAAGITLAAVAILTVKIFFATGAFDDPSPAYRVHSEAVEPTPNSPGYATVDGVISRVKLSPSGRHVHGFHLDNGTEVNLPPHAHEAYFAEVGQWVEVSGTVHTNLAGESLVNAKTITSDDATLDIDAFAPRAKGKHSKGKT